MRFKSFEKYLVGVIHNLSNFIFSSTGIISVDVQLVGGKMSEKDVILIKECMEAVIILVSDMNLV